MDQPVANPILSILDQSSGELMDSRLLGPISLAQSAKPSLPPIDPGDRNIAMARTITRRPTAANENKVAVKPRQSVGQGQARPTPAQRAWLERGLNQPGGKLPLFDRNGQRINPRTIRACIARGWAAPWYNNPVKPDWLICKLTADGRTILGDR